MLLIAVGGCTTTTAMAPRAGTVYGSATLADNSCTDILATNGGILKLCQTEKTVDVFESGVDSRNAAGHVSLVDDPRVLSALQAQLVLRPEFAASRRFVSRSCLIGDRRYLTIAMESLQRILSRRDARIVVRGDRTYLEPTATGAIATAATVEAAPPPAPPSFPPMIDPR